MSIPSLETYEQYLAQLIPQPPELRAIRDVEMDLKGSLNPSTLLHQLYFEQYNWLSFQEFFELYTTLFEQQLAANFNITDWTQFGNGLQARLYRTQFGFLTEYHAYYLAMHIFGITNVFRSTLLDKKGVDFQINYMNALYNIHIFVDTPRAWAFRNIKSTTKSVDSEHGIHVNLPYSLAENRFNSLRYLPNRFGVYTAAYFQYLKEEMGNGRIVHNNIVGTTPLGFVYNT
jgi:hypothetical protein